MQETHGEPLGNLASPTSTSAFLQRWSSPKGQGFTKRPQVQHLQERRLLQLAAQAGLGCHHQLRQAPSAGPFARQDQHFTHSLLAAGNRFK